MPQEICLLCEMSGGRLAFRYLCDGLGGIVAGRHVSSWRDLTSTEQSSVLHLVSIALAEGKWAMRPSQISGHFVLKLEDRTSQSQPLISGADDPLLGHLVRHIDKARAVDLAVAFAMGSGVSLLFPWLEDLLARGGRLRLVVGDYLDVTDPGALRKLMDLDREDLSGTFEAYVFVTDGTSFHPKAWLFQAIDSGGATIVGSSNLSRSALTSGIEWNLQSRADADVAAVAEAFEVLLADPRVVPLTDAWIDGYAKRRVARPQLSLGAKLEADEPPEKPPEPHAVQQEALGALALTRRDGILAGLVVLATGLGKTWLAAFDSRGFERVLFVAHREEILAQAMATFRKVRPEARFGLYSGKAKELGEVTFASIQTLGRAEHLAKFASDDFDYIAVDEFHHASAQSYRQLLDHFTPRFLLGLTATPERSDGGDLLALCGENLVYRCDLYEGITRGLLSAFQYFGVPDEVDYAQIPWRSNRFDIDALTSAVATQARAQNALEQLDAHGAGPAIGFCVSQRHADFMAEFFRKAGRRAVAVHAGASSAPRASSLEALGRGELDILFAVDMFNEGVDVPNIGTVLMLRPTKSTILFLQQLGRGLRKSGDKVLRVIDYIGNHRSFLVKARALLGDADGDRSLALKLVALSQGQFELPAGCEITYDLKALDFLQQMLKPRLGQDEAEAWYLNFRSQHGQRPRAGEFAHAGFDPSRTGHGLWFDLVRDLGDGAPGALEVHRSLLKEVETTRSDRAEPLALLYALLPHLRLGERRDTLWAKAKEAAAKRNIRLSDDLLDSAWTRWAMSPHFRVEGDLLSLRRAPAAELEEMLAELIEWRLIECAGRIVAESVVAESGKAFQLGPSLFQEYMREDIPPLFGAEFNPGNWNAGIVSVGRDLVLLTTLKKGSLSAGNHYEDRFLSPTVMQWQSQSRTTQASNHGRILSGQAAGHRVHLFVRGGKLRNGKAAPFLYLGVPRFLRWEGERPITIEWELSQAVPDHLRKVLFIP